MDRNVDLMRLLLLDLERRERSPVEPVFLPLDELAARLGTDREDIVDALKSLRELDFIEDPGAYRDQWLFRKTTQRGAALFGLVADEREWRKVKRAYGLLIER